MTLNPPTKQPSRIPRCAVLFCAIALVVVTVAFASLTIKPQYPPEAPVPTRSEDSVANDLPAGIMPQQLYVAQDGLLAAINLVDEDQVVVRAVGSLASHEHIEHLFDYVPRHDPEVFLVSKALPVPIAPHAWSGYDLWLLTRTGTERRIAEGVRSAAFSPDGSFVAYDMLGGTLIVETIDGQVIAKYNGAVSPTWHPDSKVLAFIKKIPSDNPKLIVSGSTSGSTIALLDLPSRTVRFLTSVPLDVSNPTFHPSGKWLLFESSLRTGRTSFWRISISGGEPTQLTNLSTAGGQELIVPASGGVGRWSEDGRYFLYDYRYDDEDVSWALEFTSDDQLAHVHRIGEGRSPQPVATTVEGDLVVVLFTEDSDGHLQPHTVRVAR